MNAANLIFPIYSQNTFSKRYKICTAQSSLNVHRRKLSLTYVDNRHNALLGKFIRASDL